MVGMGITRVISLLNCDKKYCKYTTNVKQSRLKMIICFARTHKVLNECVLYELIARSFNLQPSNARPRPELSNVH